MLSSTAEYHTVSCHDYTHYRGCELTAGVGQHDPLLGSDVLELLGVEHFQVLEEL